MVNTLYVNSTMGLASVAGFLILSALIGCLPLALGFRRLKHLEI